MSKNFEVGIHKKRVENQVVVSCVSFIAAMIAAIIAFVIQYYLLLVFLVIGGMILIIAGIVLMVKERSEKSEK
jgi:uncharacterized membrane protein HdeD (DUF308 family)